MEKRNVREVREDCTKARLKLIRASAKYYGFVSDTWGIIFKLHR